MQHASSSKDLSLNILMMSSGFSIWWVILKFLRNIVSKSKLFMKWLNLFNSFPSLSSSSSIPCFFPKLLHNKFHIALLSLSWHVNKKNSISLHLLAMKKKLDSLTDILLKWRRRFCGGDFLNPFSHFKKLINMFALKLTLLFYMKLTLKTKNLPETIKI